MHTLSSLAGWIELHPLLFTLVIWPFVLGLFTLLFKPRTPEEYAAIARISPRVAGFLQLMGALGIDPAKAAAIFVQKVLMGGGGVNPPTSGKPNVITAKSQEPPRLVRFAFAALVCFVCMLVGCSLFTPKNINAALTDVQLACVFESELTDEKTLGQICSVADDLIPIIKKLVAQREAAKRSGVTWQADGGSSMRSSVGQSRCPEGGAP